LIALIINVHTLGRM